MNLDDQTFDSLYRAAKAKEEGGRPDDEVIAAYLSAAEAAPDRAEALHAAARFCRAKGRNEEGFQYASRGAAIPAPASGSIEPWIYQWGLLDEIGINGFWSGHYREAADACLGLLASPHLPEDQRERIAANARFSLDKLAETPVAPASGGPAADAPGRPRTFACFGLHSSGSTWMYNLIREVARAGGIPFVSVHRDSSANLPWDAPGEPLIIAKTHNPMADFQALVGASTDPVVITARDPRDAVVSLMQRFPASQGASIDKALDAVALSAERLVTIAGLRSVPVFRYEDGFIGDAATVARVAGLLGVTLSAEQGEAIAAGLSANTVRETIDKLQAAGVIQGEEVWDRETHWHAGHVGDGKVGKWSEVLTPEQGVHILERTKTYCELFGYGDAARLRPPAPLRTVRCVRPDSVGYVQLSEQGTFRQLGGEARVGRWRFADDTLVLSTDGQAEEQFREVRGEFLRSDIAPPPALSLEGRSIPAEITDRMAAQPETAEWARTTLDRPRLGIVIPYRNRQAHLDRLIPHLISFFDKDAVNSAIQPLIVVAEQADDRKFNRGFCRNAGFAAAAPYCDYVCFHDVDYLPMWADYGYANVPARIIWGGLNHRPIRVGPDNTRWTTSNKGLFGAVVVMDKDQFVAANGYSNRYEGWGWEDADLKRRLEAIGVPIRSRDGTFIPLDHDHDGYSDDGAKSPEWIANEARYRRLKPQYLETHDIPEGLSTMRFAGVDVAYERWSGIDGEGSGLICRLRVSQAQEESAG